MVKSVPYLHQGNPHMNSSLSRYWRIPHHPILAISLTCMLGIIAQHQYNAFIVLLPAATLIIALTLQSARSFFRLLSISFILFITAFLYERQKQNHAYILQQVAREQSLTIKIVDKEAILHSPRYKELLIGELHNSSLLPELPFASPWKIYLYRSRESNTLPGDQIEISNMHNRPLKENDFTSFLCKEGIATTLFLTQKNNVTLLHRPVCSITRWLWCKRKKMLCYFEQSCSKEAFELASCLFWGNRTIIKQNPDMRELFKKVGIVHYLARSGLHLIIFMFIWQLLLKAAPLSFRKKQCLLLFAGSIYFLFTWPSISFLRAFFLFTFFAVAAINRWRTHLFYLLCLTCILFLICNPIQLFFLDFQLTFGLTCALIWHNHVEQQIKMETSRNH